MKKNFSLLFILITLLIFAYYKEEKDSFEKTSILAHVKLEDIISIKAKNFEIKLLGDKFKIGENILVDRTQLSYFFYFLKRIRIQREIKKQELSKEQKRYLMKNFLEIVLKLREREISIKLGHKNSFDQNFYMQIENRIVIAYDDNDFTAFYSKQNQHNSDQRYRRVKSIFELPSSYFEKKSKR